MAVALGDVRGAQAALFALGLLAITGPRDPEARVGFYADQTDAVADGACAHCSHQRSSSGGAWSGGKDGAYRGKGFAQLTRYSHPSRKTRWMGHVGSWLFHPEGNERRDQNGKSKNTKDHDRCFAISLRLIRVSGLVHQSVAAVFSRPVVRGHSSIFSFP